MQEGVERRKYKRSHWKPYGNHQELVNKRSIAIISCQCENSTSRSTIKLRGWIFYCISKIFRKKVIALF